MSKPLKTLLVNLAVGVLIATFAGPALAASGGRARILRPDGTTPLDRGGPDTPYAVGLPLGAACPGDTAKRGFRIWSYLVPKGTDLLKIAFTGLMPQPGLGLIANGDFYGPVNTAQGTGEIVGVPNDFVFSRLTPAMLFTKGARTATWEAGLACSDAHGAMTRYWNVEVAFTATPSEQGGFSWTVTHPPSTSSHGSNHLVGVALLAMSVAGGGAWWASHRRRPAHTERPPSSLSPNESRS